MGNLRHSLREMFLFDQAIQKYFIIPIEFWVRDRYDNPMVCFIFLTSIPVLEKRIGPLVGVIRPSTKSVHYQSTFTYFTTKAYLFILLGGLKNNWICVHYTDKDNPKQSAALKVKKLTNRKIMEKR
jgi:hypothetical protein